MTYFKSDHFNEGGSVIDISPAAARALAMINRGVIYVRADVL
jgi:rare lipoprotein A (peptidoglycan hydrolase)